MKELKFNPDEAIERICITIDPNIPIYTRQETDQSTIYTFDRGPQGTSLFALATSEAFMHGRLDEFSKSNYTLQFNKENDENKTYKA